MKILKACVHIYFANFVRLFSNKRYKCTWLRGYELRKNYFIERIQVNDKMKTKRSIHVVLLQSLLPPLSSKLVLNLIITSGLFFLGWRWKTLSWAVQETNNELELLWKVFLSNGSYLWTCLQDLMHLVFCIFMVLSSETSTYDLNVFFFLM